MTFPRFKLYHYPATRSARVKWLLHEVLDENFDVEVVPLYEGVQYSPAYLEKNPNHNVPALEITLENGDSKMMLESGAMITLLADIFPEKALCPPPQVFSVERADYLHMLHFGTSWMDMMLWQVRIHTHLLGPDADAKTLARYENKFRNEVEPQLLGRFDKHDFICGERFSAADCVMGQNVLWAQAYGLCQDERFGEYINRLSARPAFQKAYADLGDFSLAPPANASSELASSFSG
jgi:glutathione S-transferase